MVIFRILASAYLRRISLTLGSGIVGDLSRRSWLRPTPRVFWEETNPRTRDNVIAFNVSSPYWRHGSYLNTNQLSVFLACIMQQSDGLPLSAELCKFLMRKGKVTLAVLRKLNIVVTSHFPSGGKNTSESDFPRFSVRIDWLVFRFLFWNTAKWRSN